MPVNNSNTENARMSLNESMKNVRENMTFSQALFMLIIILAGSLLSFPAFAGTTDFPRIGRITSEGAKLLSAPTYQATVVREAKLNEEFTVVQRVSTFYLVKDTVSGSFLFVDQLAVSFLEKVPESERRKKYIRDDIMRLGLSHPDWQFSGEYKNYRARGRKGFDVPYDGRAKGKSYPTNYSSNYDYVPMVDGEKVLAVAKRYLGMPYRLGGNGNGSIDCSALTAIALASQGIELPRRASLQASFGRMVSKSELKVGDLVFFRDNLDPGFLSHVGIYAGGGRFLHASASLGKVGYSSLSEPYYASHFAFGRAF